MSLHRIEEMSVEISGSGENVIMLPGLGASAHAFEPLQLALGSQYRTIRPELPASARSTVPLALSMESIADRIESMMDVLSIDHAHLVGHSLGTHLCQRLAVKLPNRVNSLMLFGPITEPPEAAKQALRGRAVKIRSEGIQSVVDAVIPAITSTYTQQNRPVAIAMIHQMLEAQSDEGYALMCEALANMQAIDVRTIRCPVLLITGQDDVITPPSMLQILSDQLVNSRSKILENCGHVTTLECPDECMHQAKSFLESLSR